MMPAPVQVVEAYRLDRYDNLNLPSLTILVSVVEAYRLDRYDNFHMASIRAAFEKL